ncbi:hypothetical protein niasHT_009586 [Heterodera trifolii]|uniref:Secreted protein n=1 Tax=Heterodera trifolii TaxID=157864 RepID=A0ABD2M5D4_9BILA
MVQVVTLSASLLLAGDRSDAQRGDEDANTYDGRKCAVSFDQTVILSASLFRCFSPLIDRMLSVEMREKQQRSVTLNELRH